MYAAWWTDVMYRLYSYFANQCVYDRLHFNIISPKNVHIKCIFSIFYTLNINVLGKACVYLLFECSV